MYNQQKRDALDFWRMQNAYNTPAAQMQRFKAAGLNPNLIYGRGSEGNAGAVNVPSQAHWEGKAPQMAGAQSIERYFDVRQKQQVINNLGAQNDLLRAQTASTSADAAKKIAHTKLTGINTSILSKYGLDTAAEKLRQIQVQNKYSTDENMRRSRLTAANLKNLAVDYLNKQREYQKSGREIARIDADISRIRSATSLNEIDIRMRNAGINWNDPAWMRFIQRHWSSWKQSFKSMFPSVGSGLSAPTFERKSW